jgi:hypothetical protein
MGLVQTLGVSREFVGGVGLKIRLRRRALRSNATR